MPDDSFFPTEELPGRCLIVEDDPAQRQLMATLLESKGYEVTSSASNAKVESLVSAQPNNATFDVMLLDYNTPEMSAFEVIKVLKQRPDPDPAHILVLTADHSADRVVQCLDAGAHDLIRKPYSTPELLARVGLHVRQRRLEQQVENEIRLRREAQTQLTRRLEFIRSLLELMPAPIFYKHKGGKYLGCNKAFEQFLGMKQDDLVGKTVFDIAPKELAEIYHQRDLDCMASPDPQIYESKVKDSLGTEHDVVFYKAPLYDETGGVSGLVGVVMDITEKRWAEAKLKEYAENMQALAQQRAEQLIHSDRLALLGTMSAGLAHEISNCINLIGPNAQLIRKYWGFIEPLLPDAETAGEKAGQLAMAREGLLEALDDINTGIDRSSVLLTGLKNYARKGQHGLTACSIVNCICDALNLCRNLLKYGVTVHQDIAEGLPEVKADPRQIEQVLVNLIKNACQAMGGAGDLRIAVQVEGDMLAVRVEDSGPGITAEQALRIWEPFFTTKGAEDGTGLGLHISRTILQEHGGSLDLVESSLGGAAFELRLPLPQPE